MKRKQKGKLAKKFNVKGIKSLNKKNKVNEGN